MDNFSKQLKERCLPPLLRREDGNPENGGHGLCRERIKELLQQEFMGRAPQGITGRYKLESEDADFYGGKAVMRRYTISLSKCGEEYSYPFLLVFPKIGGPHPVFLHLQFDNSIAGGMGEELIDNGYAVAHVCYSDIAPDDSREDFDGLCGFDPKPHGDRWGKIAVWACGAKHIMDCLCGIPQIDSERAAVIGHSRLGLTALWCGAMDERFSLTAAINSGSLYRGSAAESFKDLSREYTRYWFCPNLFKGGRDAGDLPFDMHYLLALIAPRALFISGATRDLWTDANSQVLAAIAAGEAYSLYGREGLKNPELKPGRYMDGSIGFYLREGTHYFGRDDWHAVMDFRKKRHI